MNEIRILEKLQYVNFDELPLDHQEKLHHMEGRILRETWSVYTTEAAGKKFSRLLKEAEEQYGGTKKWGTVATN